MKKLCELSPIDQKLDDRLRSILLGERLPLDILNSETGEFIIPAHRKIKSFHIRKMVLNKNRLEIDPSPIRARILQIVAEYQT